MKLAVRIKPIGAREMNEKDLSKRRGVSLLKRGPAKKLNKAERPPRFLVVSSAADRSLHRAHNIDFSGVLANVLNQYLQNTSKGVQNSLDTIEARRTYFFQQNSSLSAYIGAAEHFANVLSFASKPDALQSAWRTYNQASGLGIGADRNLIFSLYSGDSTTAIKADSMQNAVKLLRLAQLAQDRLNKTIAKPMIAFWLFMSNSCRCVAGKNFQRSKTFFRRG